MASSITIPLIIHNDDNREPTDQPPVTRSSIGKVLAGFFVSMLVLSSLVAITHNQLQKPHGSRQSTITTTTYSSRSKDSGADDSIEWQRSAYHFQPDKNFISGMYRFFCFVSNFFILIQFSFGIILFTNQCLKSFVMVNFGVFFMHGRFC